MGRTRPASGSVLLRLGARELDDLGPFLGFVGHEPPELGGRHRHWIGAQTFDPGVELRIGEASYDLLTAASLCERGPDVWCKKLISLRQQSYSISATTHAAYFSSGRRCVVSKNEVVSFEAGRERGQTVLRSVMAP